MARPEWLLIINEIGSLDFNVSEHIKCLWSFVEISHAKEFKVYDITDILRTWDGDI
jgi:hypothetical protein